MGRSDLAPQLNPTTSVGQEAMGLKSGQVKWEKRKPPETVEVKVQPKTMPFNLSAEPGAPDSPEVVLSGSTFRNLDGSTEDDLALVRHLSNLRKLGFALARQEGKPMEAESFFQNLAKQFPRPTEETEAMLAEWQLSETSQPPEPTTLPPSSTGLLPTSDSDTGADLQPVVHPRNRLSGAPTTGATRERPIPRSLSPDELARCHKLLGQRQTILTNMRGTFQVIGLKPDDFPRAWMEELHLRVLEQVSNPLLIGTLLANLQGLCLLGASKAVALVVFLITATEAMSMLTGDTSDGDE